MRYAAMISMHTLIGAAFANLNRRQILNITLNIVNIVDLSWFEMVNAIIYRLI